MQYTVYPTETEAGAAIAGEILSLLEKKPDALLCLAAGHSSLPVFDALLKSGADLSRARFVGLDDWLGVPAENPGNCGNFLHRSFFDLMPGIKLENIVLFDSMTSDPAAECRRIEAHIDSAGGIDYLLLGMGLNGHLALNEPGSSFGVGARVVQLDAVTQRVAQKYFTEGMPPITEGITLGIKNILACREIVLAVFGAHKAGVVKRLVSENAPDEGFPASALHTAPGAKLVLDAAAAQKL